jgi:oxygen-independent coproporphyrinogen-3 oxidase
MAGVYIHIPFCITICGYCDFYRIAGTDLSKEYVEALIKETQLRKDYPGGETIVTIYFGGGTPSALPAEDLGRILEQVYSSFTVSESPEITIEVNPDDINKTYLKALRKKGFNRISIGIQSLNDKYLRILNRRHDAKSAANSVRLSLEAGFDNLSVDLIYGLPGMTTGEWKEELGRIFGFGIKHLSAYHLTIEKGTPFSSQMAKGVLTEIDEEESNSQFAALVSKSAEAGFIHYEISNFCRDGYFSKHNMAYWKQVPYIGLGPSAHSFNGWSRQWNISDVRKYIDSLEKEILPFEREEIDFRKRFNEYIMTSLRTMWGIDLDYIESVFEKEGFDYIINLADRFLSYGMMKREKNHLVLTNQGMMISDNIISEFMMV